MMQHFLVNAGFLEVNRESAGIFSKVSFLVYELLPEIRIEKCKNRAKNIKFSELSGVSQAIFKDGPIFIYLFFIFYFEEED